MTINMLCVIQEMSAYAYKGKEIDKGKYSNPDNDPKRPWMSSPMDGIATKDKHPNLHYNYHQP